MSWIDIACIVFVCVTANHLGLISAVEKVIRHELIVVNCPRCLTFWATLAYGCFHITACQTAIAVLAISFLASYAALWLELLEGFIDTLYNKVYETIYPGTTDDPNSADGGTGDPDGSMPELRETCPAD